MKKKFSALAIFLLVSYFSFSQLDFAGDFNLTAGSIPGAREIKNEKELNKISLKVTKYLDRSFPQQKRVQWFTNENGIFAYLTVDSIKMRSDFDKKGNWLYNLRYYNESLLPQNVRYMVKSTYYDFNITGVYELESAGKTIYLVNIEDKKSYKTIIVHDDEMEVYNSFDKY